MGAEPSPAPTRPIAPGVSIPSPDNAGLNDDVTLGELSICIKRLKHGKSPGNDGVLADMIKDGGSLLKECLLWLFNCMLASHFPKRLPTGLITAVYKSRDDNNLSNYRGVTVGPVIAKLSAMILEQRIASWAKKQGIKTKGQAGFRKDFRTTDNTFIVRSVIDHQRRTRQKGKAGKLYCCFVDFKKASILYLVLCCGRCWNSLLSVLESWTLSSLFTHTIAQQYGRHKACLPSFDA